MVVLVPESGVRIGMGHKDTNVRVVVRLLLPRREKDILKNFQVGLQMVLLKEIWQKK